MCDIVLVKGGEVQKNLIFLGYYGKSQDKTLDYY